MPAGRPFGLQVLELRVGEDRRLHTRRALRPVEVFHCARRGSNRTVHLPHVLTQHRLIPAGPVLAFIDHLHPAPQAARLVRQAEDGKVTAAEMLPAVQAGELGLAESLPPPATEAGPVLGRSATYAPTAGPESGCGTPAPPVCRFRRSRWPRCSPAPDVGARNRAPTGARRRRQRRARCNSGRFPIKAGATSESGTISSLFIARSSG